MKIWDMSQNVQFGRVKYDYLTHTFADMQGGSLIRLPRPLISGRDYSEFTQILSEMYFTMLFNKNQDDPTHSSFQVLDKIIEGEESFKDVKKDGLHLGYENDVDDIYFARKILKDKRTHMFSRVAIEIGAKLLRKKLNDPGKIQIKESVIKRNVNKTLDEFATYKSSSTLSSRIFTPTMKQQNHRKKCIEAVGELLDSKDCKTSYDVATQFRKEETYFHVFKKNQIDGEIGRAHV